MKRKKVLSILLIALNTNLVAQYAPFEVSLSVLDRIVINELLPKKASFATWKIINDLRNELAPTEAELKQLDLRDNPDGSGVIGNWNAVPEKKIVFGESAQKMIVDALKELDNKGELSSEHLTVYKKFVIKENE